MAITADSVVVDVLANTGQHDSAVKQSAATFEDAGRRTLRAANDIENAAKRAAYAQRNVGRQIADVGAQLAGGQNPFLIIAQQAPQVADALADVGGAAGRVAAFFAGPWGAAILAGASILGTVLIPKLFETGDAADSAAKKIRSFATAADLAKQADEVLKLTQQLGELQATYDSIAGNTPQGRRFFAGTVRGKELQQQIDAVKFDIQSTRQIIANRNEQIASIEKADAAAKDARKNEIESRKQQRAEEREAAKAQKEMLQDLVSLEKAYDPLAASAREYYRVLKDIETLQKAGLISSATAEVYRNGADIARRAAALKSEGADQPSINDILNRPGGISDRVSADNERIVKEFNGKLDTERKLQAYRENNVRSLASLYESAFTDGARGIGRALESALISAIAKALAEKTVDSLGSFATSLTSAFGFGRASGGYVAPGQMVRVNEGSAPGRVEGFRPLGAGHVVPLGRMNAKAGSGGVTVMQTIAVDARGAVMNDQFAEMILARSGEQAIFAAQFAASAGAAPFASATRPRLPGT